MNLKFLTDHALLQDTKTLVEKEKGMTLTVLHHFKEIEDRKLYADLKCSSLYDYAVRELGYSEASAYRRIQASRLLSELPILEAKLLAGTLNLSHLTSVGQFFREEKITSTQMKLEIIEMIENTSKLECERQLRKLSSIPREFIFRFIFDVDEETKLRFEEFKDLTSHKNFSDPMTFNWALVKAIKAVRKERFHVLD